MHSNNSPPKPPNINSVFKLDCNSSIAGPLLRILLLAICLLLSSLSLAIQAKPNGQHHNQQQQTNNRQIINSNQYGNQNTNQINHQLQHNSNHNNNNNINDSNNTNGHKYYGSLIGKLIGHKNNISGEVYAVDEQTLFIKSFSHDGQAQDAYFWSSVSSALPSAEGGFIVPDEKGSTKPLERYQNKDIVLRLPEGRTLREISWLSIWSRPIKFSVADIMIPQQLIIPRPLEISPLSQLAHGVKSGPITIVDAQTFLVPDFHYDGLGPAGYFWLTRGGSGLAANGLRLKDENGGSNPLRKYTGETVVISLPDELTVYDFDYFGVWCKEFQVNFGQTKIPQAARLPPSPKMLGIKPENKLNCEILYDDLGYEIRWVLDGDDIVMQLVGKIEPGEYMAFGLGKDDSKSDMKNADAVVTWVDRPNGQVHAIDYFLGSKAQCGAVATGSSSSIGSCPDVKLPNGGDSLTLLHGAIVNGYSMVTFKRPQLGIDELYDQHVYSDGQQSVLWAIGVLNGQKEIGYHRLHTKGNMFIDFARNPQWNCPIPDLNASMHNNLPITSASQMHSTVLSGSSNSENQLDEGEGPTGGIGSSQDSRPSSPASLANQNQPPVNQNSNLNSNQSQKPVQMGSQGQAAISSTGNQQSPWFIPSIVCPSDKTFFAQIGPTGGPKKGYEGLTGRPSWGVAWYINGLMAPELVLERGQSYKFVVEGGNDKTSTTRRHPLYLTDSPEGGFDFKTDEERQRERIFAGVALRGDGQFVPTAEGRLCELRATNVTLANPDNYPTFSAYQRTLKLDCLAGQASFLKFVPDSNTPDTIYYQCYTHRYMGWRIKVVDSCQAYVNSLAKSMMSSATSKRDTRFAMGDQMVASSELRPSVDRRESHGFGDINMMASLLSPSDSGSQMPGISEGRTGLNNFNFASDNFNLAGDSSDFGDEMASSSPFTSTELSTIPSDMLIMNASQLMQKQPVNLSTLEQILKFAPNDLEFMDNGNNAEYQQTLATLASQFAGFQNAGKPVQMQHMAGNSPESTVGPNQRQQVKVAPNVKPTKGSLNSYMKRLASIYYPVQQQLASILSTGSATTNGAQANLQPPTSGAPSATTTSSSSSSEASHFHPTPVPLHLASNALQSSQMRTQQQPQHDPIPSAPSEQSSSFSLSSLVPKPKIDLSKSNISKKLNKLRIKSGRKYEPTGASSVGQNQKPPTPTNEFNYDIFNNQLAQLEKQQRQLQSLESMAGQIWPQPTSESLNYLPLLSNPQDDPRHLYHQQPPTMEDIQSASQMFGGGGNNLLNVERYPSSGGLISGSSNNIINNHNRIIPSLQAPRTSTTQLGPQTSYGQTPQVTDYFSMIFNTPGNQQQPHQSQVQRDQNLQQQQQQQQAQNHHHNQQQQHQSHLQSQPSRDAQQHAVFITRLPPSELQVYQQHLSSNHQQQPPRQPNWPPASEAVRYPNIQPYGQSSEQQQQQQGSASGSVEYQPQQQYPNVGNGMSTMHSSPLSSHESRDAQVNHMNSVNAEGESLSGSGSGSHYEFKVQPQFQSSQKSANVNANSNEQADYMLAIERFSKQPSERRPPSIVHPVTGEQVHYVLTSGPSPLVDSESSSQVNYQQQQQRPFNNSGQNEINGSRPSHRYSNILIDKNVMASSPSPPISDILDVDQSIQMTSELRRLNSTPSTMQTKMLSTNNNNNNNNNNKFVTIDDQSGTNKRTGSFLADHNQNQTTMQQQVPMQTQSSAPPGQSISNVMMSSPTSTMSSMTTQEPISSTLIKPTSEIMYDMSYNQVPMPTTTSSSVGPLVPSVGLPILSQHSNQEGELVLKSTLVEPAIVSTLVQTPSYAQQPPQTLSTTNPFNQHTPLFSGQNFDTNPFIPIELINTQADPSMHYMNKQQQQYAASPLLANRLRPSPLIESMLTQYTQSSQYKPEPPVQVASYLSQHLAAHGSMSNMPSKQNNTADQQTNSSTVTPTSMNPQEQLIILKPSPLDSASRSNGRQHTNQQTYALKPEYMTNQFKMLGNGGVTSLTDNSLYSNPNDNSDLLYTSSSSNDFLEPARRLAGHQFERLSSLSSPPSTSISLDPMQVAHSVTSYVKSSSSSATSENRNHNYDEKQKPPTITTTTSQQVAPIKLSANETSSSTNNMTLADQEQLKLEQHRQTSLLTKPISLTVLQAADGVRKYPGGDNINTLPRDNNTDNAILSHVMSLISSNAIPAPFPFASHSSAEFFMPSPITSDRLFSRSLRRG